MFLHLNSLKLFVRLSFNLFHLEKTNLKPKLRLVLSLASQYERQNMAYRSPNSKFSSVLEDVKIVKNFEIN